MSKFKVGDKVRCLYDNKVAPVKRGYEGVVIVRNVGVGGDEIYDVDFGTLIGSWYMGDNELEAVDQ